MKAESKKSGYLKETVEHYDLRRADVVPIVDMMAKMAFSARDLARGAAIYDRMLADDSCSILLCLAGSLFSAGLRKIVADMVENNMVDCIVSTGAIIVDQDFFEALGFRHYQGSPHADDSALHKAAIDRIYDTYIDEDELRVCDMTVAKVADSLEPRPMSSREFLQEMGRFLARENRGASSVVRAAYEKGVPIFVPAFSDCSAGFGLVHHQVHRTEHHVTIDSVQDFRELTHLKVRAGNTGLLMIGGGVPKNFAQDVVVAADILGEPSSMHKYAVQVTVADVRDGALSSSTLKEAHTWGKVDQGAEQMVYCEATIGLPLIAGYAYQKGSWKRRKARNFAGLFRSEPKKSQSRGRDPAREGKRGTPSAAR